MARVPLRISSTRTQQQHFWAKVNQLFCCHRGTQNVEETNVLKTASVLGSSRRVQQTDQAQWKKCGGSVRIKAVIQR